MARFGSSSVFVSQQVPAMRRWRVLDRQTVVEACVGVLVLAYYMRNFALRLADPDLWGRMAVGQLFLRRHGMPRTDPFAYTPILPRWVDHEWLTGVVFYLADRAFGESSLIVIKMLAGMGMMYLVWRTARLNGAGRMPLLVVLALSMPVFGYGMMPRAQVFTYLFFALWLYLLEHYRQGGSWRCLAVLPACAVVWANLHGGFLAGLGLLLLYAIGMASDRARLRPLLLALAASFAVTLINPYGLAYWSYLIPAVTMHRPGIQEWAPVPLRINYWQFWLLVIGGIASVARWREFGRQRLAPALAVAVTLLLAVRHARHMPLFAITACGLLAGIWFARWESIGWRARRPWRPLDVVLVVALVAATLVQLHGLAADGPLRLDVPENGSSIENSVSYPVGAVEFATSQQLRGNIAVPFNWGEYCIWYLYPNCKVSLDGRYETAYPPATVELVDRFFAGEPGWEELLDRYPTQYVLAPIESPINAKLAECGWKLLFVDRAAQLWSRQ